MRWIHPLTTFYLIWAIISNSFTAQAQGAPAGAMPPQCELLDSAMTRLKQGDTATAIGLLEQNVATYPRTAAASASCLQLGLIYQNMGASDSARGRLIHVLNNVVYEERGCNADFALQKTKGAVAMSKSYDNEGDFERGLYFLQLADTAFMPDYGENEAARVGYRTNLSVDYAAHYLRAGDTMAATTRLLSYFARTEGNWQATTIELRTILLRRRSATRLKADIEKAMQAVTELKVIDEEGKGRLMYTMTLYGQPIYTAESTSKKSFRKVLRSNAALKLLREGAVGQTEGKK